MSGVILFHCNSEQLSAAMIEQRGLVMIPKTLQYFSTAIWGLDANALSHGRFLMKPNEKENTVKQHDASTLRAFGSVPLLFPRRHYSIG